MPDPFGILPLPIPIFILNGLEDLGTLHHLLQASPAANSIFAQHYCEVAEAILANFVPELRQLLRVVVSIRSQPVLIRALCNSLEAFDAFRAIHIRGPDAGVTVLSKSTTTLAAVRSLAGTAAQVQRLSASFFATHLARINNIRPYRSDGRKHWDPKWDRGETEPELVRYHIQKCEEPSWVEEQRVLRALWRVVVYRDIQDLTPPYEGQKGKLWDTLAAEGPLRVWLRLDGDGKHNRIGKLCWDLQELECVHDFLLELSYPAMHLQRLPVIEASSYTTPKELPFLDITENHRSHMYREVQLPSRGYPFFCSEIHDVYRFALSRCDFKPFRLLGLGIWDRKRLEKLGLAVSGNWKLPSEIPEDRKVFFRDHTPRCEIAIRWRSLLIPEAGDSHADKSN